jgi:hypothetical protein
MKRVFRTPSEDHYFFGYYDKSPLDASSTRILAQRTSFINRMPTLGESMEVGYFDFPDNGTFHSIGRTLAWNWQQGCMLQWCGPDFNKEVIYNDLRDGCFVSVVYDIAGSAERVLPLPIYTASGDGKWGLCVDYERHYWFRPGYNYQGPPNPTKNKPVDPEDGIWLMCLKSGEFSRIISLEGVMNTGWMSIMDGGTHYLEHLMINPSSERFCFLHRWKNVDGEIYTRLFSANMDGSGLYLLNDSGRMSHFCWRDREWIFAYGGLKTSINRLRSYKKIAKHVIKPLLPLYHRLAPEGGFIARQITGDGYLLFKDRSDESRRISLETLTEDGHPTFRPGSRNMFVVDNYPDEKGDCPLYVFDLQSSQIVVQTTIATDPALRATGYRCDLHPKWSFDGRFVSIDRAIPGRRSMEVFTLEGL